VGDWLLTRSHCVRVEVLLRVIDVAQHFPAINHECRERERGREREKERKKERKNGCNAPSLAD